MFANFGTAFLAIGISLRSHFGKYTGFVYFRENFVNGIQI